MNTRIRMAGVLHGGVAAACAAVLASAAAAADTYLTVDTEKKAGAKDLCFLVTFDNHHVRADFAKGSPDTFTLKDLDLGLRGLVGFDGRSAFKPEPGEALKYHAAGNFNPHSGSLVMWTAAFDYDPDSAETDGRKRGNIALAHLMASSGGRNVNYELYEYADRVYFDWRSSVPPHGHSDIARVSVQRKGIKKGQWHQIVATWDDTRIWLYLNGEPVDNIALPAKASKTANLMPDDSDASFVGVKSPFYEDKHEWDVGVDDFALYSRALTALEIRNQYVALLKEKGSRSVASFDLVLNGVVTGPGDRLDRLEAAFDFASLSPEDEARLARGELEVSFRLTAPDGTVRNGSRKFGKKAENVIFRGVDKPGRWKLEAMLGEEKVVAEIVRPAFEWVGNGIGEEDEVPAIWKDFSVSGRVVTLWNRRYEFGDGPLPEKVSGFGKSMLARRPRLLVDGREPQWKAGPTTRRNRFVTFTGTGVAGSARLRYETTVEFDGMIRFDWRFENAAKISAMSLDWQVEPALSRYLMTPTLCEEPGDDLSFPYPKSGSHTKMLWLVTEKKGGFAYTMANDANWMYGEGENVFRVSRKTGECRVSMVTRDVDLPAGTPYQALFIATPTRPLPERNRLIRYCGPGGVPLVNADGRGRFKTVFTHEPCEGGAFERRYANARPNSLSVYGGVMALTDDAPETAYLGKYWERPGAYSYKMPLEKENAAGEVTFDRYSSRSACPTTAYTDYLVWCDWKLWTHPLGGKFWQSYFDLCGNTTCRNPLHGCRFKDRLGRTVDTFVILSLRQLLVRDVALAHKFGKTVILHGQRDFHPFIQGLADYWFPGEQYSSMLNRNLYGYTDEIPDAVYRTELNRDVLGVGVIHLPAIGHAVNGYGKDENLKYTYAMLSMLLLHDIETSELYGGGRPIRKVWDVFETYGLDSPSVRCHLYYEQDEVKSSDPDVRVTWYDCPDGRRLLVLSNKDLKPHTSRIDVSALKPGTRAREEMKGREVVIEGGAFEIRVPARNFRLVAFPPKDFYPHTDGMKNAWRSWKPPKCDSAFGADYEIGASAAPSIKVALKETGGGCFMKSLPAEPGDAFRITARAKAGQGVKSMSIGVQRPGGGPSIGSSKVVPDGTWQTLTLEVKIPEKDDWRRAAAMLITLSASGTNAVAHFDDLVVEKMASSSNGKGAL